MLAVGMTLSYIGNKNWNITSLSLPVLFLLLHMCYGVGTAVGLVCLPWWKKVHHKGESPAVERVRCALRKKAAEEG